MKKFVAATALLILSSATGFAADLPVRTFTKAPVYAAPVYNWTGFYVGAHIGGAFNGSNDEITGLTRSSNGGFLGGGQIGADYQFAPNWVVGVEGQISGLDYKRSYNNGTGGFVQEKTDWLASITGRLGYTWGAGLIYAKGGVAFRDNGGFSTSFTDTGARRDSTGYTVGGGLEYMFAPAWSAKLEYQYYNFDRTDFYRISTGATLASINSEIHTVKAGVNYHFNWGGPVVAKY
ncbi:MAG TPA: outer membrane beta-barrel protein [Afipia sp.]